MPGPLLPAPFNAAQHVAQLRTYARWAMETRVALEERGVRIPLMARRSKPTLVWAVQAGPGGWLLSSSAFFKNKLQTRVEHVGYLVRLIGAYVDGHLNVTPWLAAPYTYYTSDQSPLFQAACYYERLHGPMPLCTSPPLACCCCRWLATTHSRWVVLDVLPLLPCCVYVY